MYGLTAIAALQDHSIRDTVFALVMRRDKGRCCISPPHCKQLNAPTPHYLISPAIEPLLRPEHPSGEAKLLQALITPQNAAYLRSTLLNTTASLSNVWLLSPGLGAAIKRGKLTVRKSSSEFNYAPNPINMDAVKSILVREQ